ncbi:MAG: B12-binding domain-containing radical SAM protein [Candidatus Omnitrophica bacterium]|nr:B12-binding domain-containing radical SAM protein [Candidatus Omnitrophota bacterium]
MKVLFLYTNINGFHDDVFSFGLASIVSVTKQNGHDAEILLIRDKGDYDRVARAVKTAHPQVVGFSSVSSQFHFVKELSELVKQVAPETITVCGGVHPTINPQCVLETNALDAVFVGESEDAFAEFLKKVSRHESFEDVANMAFQRNGRFIQNKLNPLITDFERLPFPDRDNALFDETVKAVGYAPFFFSRGCPYLCSYCSNHAIAQAYGLTSNRPRFRSAESSIREIEEVVKKYSISKIAIVDDVFGIDKEWRKEFCEKYKERINIRFFCLLRANLVDEEFVRLLKDAGCYRVSIGVESGNDYVRNTVMNRKMSNEQMIQAFDLFRKYGLQTNSLNIIGTPGETEEMIWDTIRLNRRLRPTSSGVNIFYPYKGTKLGDYCFEQGLVNEELYNSFSNERRSTVLKYPEEFKKKLEYYRSHWEFLINRSNYKYHVRMLIEGLLRKLGIWNRLVQIKRSVFSRLRKKKV